MTTAKRNFSIYEEKKRVWVQIPSNKKGGGWFEGWFPKDKVKISNRVYGFGGAVNADIEFPIALAALLTETHY